MLTCISLIWPRTKISAAIFFESTRPLDEHRLASIVDKASDNANQLKDFYAGLSVALEGMLISPNFLMVAERNRGG